MYNRSGEKFTKRSDISSYDFTEATLTLDGNPHVLNLTSIIPVTAKRVLLRLYCADTVAVNSYLLVFHPDYSNYVVAGVAKAVTLNTNHHTFVEIDCKNGTIGYASSVAPTPTGCGIAVLGYWT